MEDVFTILILMLAVAVSAVVGRVLPFKLPLPLFQIACGALLALPLFGLHIGLDPELFLVLIISPLLFADASRISKRELRRHLKPISAMALSLVMFTVIGLGFFMDWLLPVSLPIAMALGAILSPTDAVAVGAMTGRTPLPRRVAHLLEGEGLLNDASGLVAFQFALAAAVTGTFSFFDASLTFWRMALGGVVIGAGLGFAAGWVRRRIASWTVDEPAIQIVIILLMPFAAYLFAERVHVSGILASVAAGLVMSMRESADGDTAGSTAARLLMRSVWSMLEFIFNGVSFVLLGLQLPAIVDGLVRTETGIEIFDAVLYVLAISAMLFAVRFTWFVLYLRAPSFRSALVGTARPTWRHIAVLTLSGVRGSVTLAAAMSIPLTLHDAPFPARDLLLFIAAGVILVTLAVGATALPLLSRRLPPDDQSAHEDTRRLARLRVAEAAVERLTHAHAQLEQGAPAEDQAVLAEVARYLRIIYDGRLRAEHPLPEVHQSANRMKGYARELRLAAVRAERETLLRLTYEGLIDEETMRELMTELDLAESWLTGTLVGPRSDAG